MNAAAALSRRELSNFVQSHLNLKERFVCTILFAENGHFGSLIFNIDVLGSDHSVINK